MATPLSIPDSMTRADIGDYMRELREHFGLSQHDVSERLNIRVKYIVAMEQSTFDALPGKVYARGYVHTYAEFLGLNADQVVDRCFGPELPREAQKPFKPAPARSRMRVPLPRGWMACVVLVVLFVVMYQAAGRRDEFATSNDEETVTTNAVENVPESLLASMRTLVMPTVVSSDCLLDESLLGCYYAQDLMQRYVLPTRAISHRLGRQEASIDEQDDAADTKQEAVKPAELAKKPEAKAEEKKPEPEKKKEEPKNAPVKQEATPQEEEEEPVIVIPDHNAVPEEDAAPAEDEQPSGTDDQ